MVPSMKLLIAYLAATAAISTPEPDASEMSETAVSVSSFARASAEVLLLEYACALVGLGGSLEVAMNRAVEDAVIAGFPREEADGALHMLVETQAHAIAETLADEIDAMPAVGDYMCDAVLGERKKELEVLRLEMTAR